MTPFTAKPVSPSQGRNGQTDTWDPVTLAGILSTYFLFLCASQGPSLLSQTTPSLPSLKIASYSEPQAW